MAFGSELLMMAGLGFVVLGPKRMQSLLAQAARIRADLEKASRGLKAQLSEELQASEASETNDALVACSSCALPSDLQKDAPAPQ